MEGNEVKYQVSGRSLIIRLPNEVDDHSCKTVKEQSDEYLRKYHINRIIFDFSETGFMDSAGIGIILGRYKRMSESGGEVVLRGEDARIKRILKISGIYQIMKSI